MARKPKSASEPVSAEKPADWPLEERLAAHKLVKPQKFATSSGDLVEAAKINEIASLLWLPESISVAERDAKIVKAMDLFESIKPAEGIEAMLAMQMVGTHHAAMECLRRAMVPQQTFEGRSANLEHAQRLMALYTQQLAALAKHRGKGQQKITVERVQVGPGGHAVLGDVHTSAQPAATHPPALEAPREDTVPLPPVPTKTKDRR